MDEQEVKTALLAKVKSAMRIKTSTLYDDEIDLYIETVLDDLNRLSVDIDSSDARIANLCILKTKSHFGNSQPEIKEVWMKMYNEQLRLVFMDGRRSKKQEVGD